MKFFTNKKIWEKVILALIFVLLFQFAVMKPVEADVVESGGKLMGPILSLLVSLCDGIMNIISRTIMGIPTDLYEISTVSSFWETLGTWAVGILAAALAIVAIVATAGLATVALAAVGITATVTVGMGTIVTAAGVGLLSAVWFNEEVLPESLYLPMYNYSAEEIFKGNILLFDVNFFNDAPEIKENKNNNGEVVYYYYIDDEGKEVKTSNQNSAVMLKKVVGSWYKALRNICLVLMLSILVYIGIRMLLSSVASDKAKYLTMLKDWFIGLCLLFLMHYIMAFSVAIVEKLTDVVKSSVDENAYTVTMAATDKMEEELGPDKLNQPDAIQVGADGKKYLNWPTNMMGSLRLQLQMEQYGGQHVGLSICFIMLCLFTLYFTITYLKRVLHMAFLTLIAPLVALTYCIDKINDGQAQGFNKWFKEYIFNLLIQPMHLLLYYILVSSAFELASTNVIYAIVAIGFMIPAEKLLRSLFGFEKAQTAPGMSTAGALMASTALNSLLRKGPKGKGSNGSSKGGDGSGSTSDNVPMPRESGNPMDAFSGERTSEQPQIGSGEDNGNNDRGNEGNPMLDAYDEQYGTEQWDAQERDAMAREAYSDDNDGMQYSDEEHENILRDSGYSDDEIRAMMEGQSEGENAGQPRTVEPPEQPEQPEQPQQTQQSQQQDSTRMQRMKRRAIRSLNASWAAQKASMRQVPNKFKRKLENAHPMRTMGKIAAGAALGTAAGAAGIAIAASTGELDNVAKIGLGSAAAGYAVGSGSAQSIKSPMDDVKVQKVHNEAYNKGKYKEDAMNDYVRRYMKDAETISYFEQKFGAAEAKKMLAKDGLVEQCLYNDINDKKEMAAIYKLKDKKVVNSIEEGIAVSQLGQMIGSNTNNMTTKSRNEWKTRLAEMAGKSGVKDTKAFAEKRLREIDKLNDFKK